MTFDIQQGQTLTGTYVVVAEGGSPNVNVSWPGGGAGMALGIPTPSSFGVSGDGWSFEVTDYSPTPGATYNWSLTAPVNAALGSGSWEFSGQIAINVQSYGDSEDFVVIAGSGSSSSSASSGHGSGSSGGGTEPGGCCCTCQCGSGEVCANSVIPDIAGVLTIPPSCVTSNVCAGTYALQYDSYGNVGALSQGFGVSNTQASNSANAPATCKNRAPGPCGAAAT